MATVTEKEIRELLNQWGRLKLEADALNSQADAVEKQIRLWLRTSGRIVTITGETAVAERCEKSSFGPREISLASFLAATADIDEADRNECLKVEIGRAEKLLGKTTVDRLSDRPVVKKMIETVRLK